MAKKNKNSDLIQIHGKEEALSRPNSPTSLDEILGESLSLYSVSSSEAYESQLAEMNMTDLQAHAYKIGLIPTSDRKILCDRLVAEFKKWNSRFVNKLNTVASDNNTGEISAKARKILREGA
jgi:hypothetical protein